METSAENLSILSGGTLVSTGGTLAQQHSVWQYSRVDRRHSCVDGTLVQQHWNSHLQCDLRLHAQAVPHRSCKLNLFGPGAFHIQCVSGRFHPSRLPIGCANQICLGRRLSHPMCGWKGLPKSFPIGRCEFQRCSGTSHGGCEVTECSRRLQCRCEFHFCSGTLHGGHQVTGCSRRSQWRCPALQ